MSDGRRRPRRKQERKRLDWKIWKKPGKMAGRRETDGRGAVQEKDKAVIGRKRRAVKRKRRVEKGSRQENGCEGAKKGRGRETRGGRSAGRADAGRRLGKRSEWKAGGKVWKWTERKERKGKGGVQGGNKRVRNEPGKGRVQGGKKRVRNGPRKG